MPQCFHLSPRNPCFSLNSDKKNRGELPRMWTQACWRRGNLSNSVVRASKAFRWHDVVREIRVRVEGNVFKAYVDGKMVLEAAHNAYTHGGVGLRTWDGSRACFQDPRIVFLAGPGRGQVSRRRPQHCASGYENKGV